MKILHSYLYEKKTLLFYVTLINVTIGGGAKSDTLIYFSLQLIIVEISLDDGSKQLPTRPYLVAEITFTYKPVLGNGNKELLTRPYLVEEITFRYKSFLSKRL